MLGCWRDCWVVKIACCSQRLFFHFPALTTLVLQSSNCSSRSRGSDALFWPLWAHAHICSYTETVKEGHTHTHEENKPSKIKIKLCCSFKSLKDKQISYELLFWKVLNNVLSAVGCRVVFIYLVFCHPHNSSCIHLIRKVF